MGDDLGDLLGLSVAPGAVFTDTADGVQYVGREAVRNLWHHLLRDAFDARLDAPLWTLTPDTALLEAQLVGRQRRRFAGADPTERPVTLPLAVACDLDRGAIARARVYLQTAPLHSDATSISKGTWT